MVLHTLRHFCLPVCVFDSYELSLVYNLFLGQLNLQSYLWLEIPFRNPIRCYTLCILPPFRLHTVKRRPPVDTNCVQVRQGD
jgi:hypothetical protein